MRNSGLSHFVLYLVIFALSGCFSENNWHVKEVAGHLPDLQFSLTSDSEHLVTAEMYTGYVLLMYFGFTNCQAECPVSMAKLSHVIQTLGKDADRIRVLFVTLDPGHDNPEVLRRYIAQFDPEHVIGLTGTTKDIQNLTKRYRAAYRPRSKNIVQSGIVHGDAIYIFDSLGHARLLATSTDPVENLAKDIRRLLDMVY
ncbi:SCO family protein [Nitrosomonas supralitoralis]|uniref:SCO family protein n=1 Tax=Nitrosomonas supralitoralis TaxID=2116706 RepID=A0A2P7NZR7_9PROT|nr:SCO family protein [Nitrosomonas supralitoralis]PSJ18982.1 SCO family protein [Nitrosomonas supralitoralis]